MTISTFRFSSNSPSVACRHVKCYTIFNRAAQETERSRTFLKQQLVSAHLGTIGISERSIIYKHAFTYLSISIKLVSRFLARHGWRGYTSSFATCTCDGMMLPAAKIVRHNELLLCWIPVMLLTHKFISYYHHFPQRLNSGLAA